MRHHISIALMLPSPLMVAGIGTLLRSLPDLPCTVTELQPDGYMEAIARMHPAILIVDPVINGVEWDALKSSSSSPMKIIAVLTQQMPKTALRWFDDSFSIYDNATAIIDVIRRNVKADEDSDKGKDLSPREKEVIVGIVKGLSNKEIALEMNVSVNTVMTHRRNIAAKLHIHTPAGLTIFAIVSNLVKLEDIKSDMDKL
ncbi:MAG: LuxR C-terminal-related transcriptional regulator [Duncaniella sp.]|uniref:LuxR C-terminal-related transcriptional regulator n=1 Tax=Duncaniella sp. TaxID=2518496 RepID=UPI0023C5D6FF|nr:LuxR C-terminal-related transcriptional regulator [Duncaniella sp.]MDE6089263.1 LuxR C-terminal-related transcriptional regulator [Duncaniella sp.]